MDSLASSAALLWLGLMHATAVRLAVGWVLALGLSLAGCTGAAWPGLVAPGAWLLRWQSADAKLHAFHRAWVARSRGDHRTAYRDFSRLAVALPELADHALYLAGDAALHLGWKKEALAPWRSLAERFPRSVRFAQAAAGVARLELERDRVDEARSWALRALPAAFDKPTEQAERLTLAAVDERQGKAEEAGRVYRELWKAGRTTPTGAEAKAAWLRLSEQRPSVRANPSELLEEARWALEERDFDLAQRLAKEAVGRGGQTLAPEAARLVAEVAYGRGQREEAWRMLWAVARRYPETKQAPKALFRLASLLWNADRDTAADRVFDEVVRRYPSSDEAPKALVARARIAFQKQDLSRALALLDQVADTVAAHETEREGWWWRGRIEWERKNVAAAGRAFAALGENDPAAVYWRARCEEAAGRVQTAARLYARARQIDRGYYALMASRRSAGLGSVTLRIGVPAVVPPAVENEPDLAFADPFHVERWRLLRKAQVKELAALEVEGMLRTSDMQDPLRRQAVLQALAQSDAYRQMVLRARQWADLDELPRQRALYPLAFWETVQASASEFRLDPLLLLAVMRQESLFDPAARSAVGARGLMQLMPATATQVAASLGLAPGKFELEEPAVNVRLGARYLRQLLDRYQDDLLKALAAYNGGERAADRWAASAQGCDPDEFVELITYRETREYVKRVLSHYAEYSRIYSSSSLAGALRERSVRPYGS